MPGPLVYARARSPLRSRRLTTRGGPRMMYGDGNQPMPTLSELRRFMLFGQAVTKPTS
jgi:hypothetical protein